MRQRLAQEAARIMADEGVHDFHAAKQKAAARLRASDTHNLPRNIEIEQALKEYQSLFHGDEHRLQLDRLRRTACQAMRYFERFRPRLVGSVLKGTAGSHSDINLQLFADTPEEMVLFLMGEGVPFEEGIRQFHYPDGSSENYPSFQFLADGVPVELTLFPIDGLRRTPLSPVDGHPMKRATLTELEAIIDAGELERTLEE